MTRGVPDRISLVQDHPRGPLGCQWPMVGLSGLHPRDPVGQGTEAGAQGRLKVIRSLVYGRKGRPVTAQAGEPTGSKWPTTGRRKGALSASSGDGNSTTFHAPFCLMASWRSLMLRVWPALWAKK